MRCWGSRYVRFTVADTLLVCHSSSFVQISIRCFALGLFSCFLLRAIVSCRQRRAISTLRFTATSYREWRKTSWGCVPRSTTTERSFTAASKTSCYRCSFVFVFVFAYVCVLFVLLEKFQTEIESLTTVAYYCAIDPIFVFVCLGQLSTLFGFRVAVFSSFLSARSFLRAGCFYLRVFSETSTSIFLFLSLNKDRDARLSGECFFRRLCLQKHPASRQTSTALSVRPKNKHTTA